MSSTQQKLRQQLKERVALKRLEQVYCRLKPSKIHGIGIFAIRKISKGTNPFKDSYMAQDGVLVNKKKVENESDNIKDLLESYHPTHNGNNQFISLFPNQLMWTNYLNYSDNPNIELMENGEWLTLRDIVVNEELSEDPNRLFNEDGTHKTFLVKEGQYRKIV